MKTLVLQGVSRFSAASSVPAVRDNEQTTSDSTEGRSACNTRPPANPSTRDTERRARSIIMDPAPDRITGPCDYAACRTPATSAADGWQFCRRHLDEHRYLSAGLELPDLPRQLLPLDHGTEAAEIAHRRRGEKPCAACREAKRLADHVRNADRYGARWHRSKDVA